MRKFFKSLAVLLALTLIVGVIPAAAADPLKMVDEKILYLGGSQGTKEDGTNCKTSYKKKVANMITGFDADTMNVDLKSADSSIVKATKAGRIYAKSIGTTTVTVTVYDAAETEIFKKDLKVKVKKNATEVAVTGIADGDKVKVGQSVDVALPRQGVDTDERSFTVDKPELAEITKGEKARTWTVKFLKAGDATFTARAYQSAKYPGKTAETVIKVAISNPAPTSAKVVASNAYELTFDTDVEAAGLFKDQKDIANDACYYMLNETKVTFSAVKEVKATGNTVKVTMYDNFASGTTYYVTVNECEPIALVIAGTAAKDVDSIAILTETVTVNTAAELKVALYNKDGVDITSSVGTDAVTYESSNLNSYIDGKTLNMYNVDDETTVTATFTYYDANNNYEEVKKTASKKIKAVAEASEVFNGLVYSVDGNGQGITSDNYANAKTYVSLSDTTFDFKAYVKIVKGTAKYGVQVNGVNTFNGKVLYAKIPEESVALFTSAGVGGLYRIQPNQQGKTNVFIGYDDTPGNPATFKTIAVAPIEVREKRYAQSLVIKPSKSNLNTTNLVLAGGSSNDSLVLKAEIKDQFQDYFDPTADGTGVVIKTTQNTQSANVATLTLDPWTKDATGKYSVTVNYDDIAYQTTTLSGNVVLTSTLTDSTSKAGTVGTNFSVKSNINRNDASDALSFANSGASTLDTTITGTTNIKAASIKAQLSSNGFFTGDIKPLWTKTVPTTANVGTSGTVTYEFQLVIKKNNDIVDPANLAATGLTNFLTTDAALSTTASTTWTLNNFYDDGNTLTKLPKANYSFTIYKIKKDDATSKNVISSKTLVVNVTDNQVNPTFTQKAEVATAGLASSNNFSECFKFSFAGKEYDNVTAGYDSKAASTNTNAYFISKCSVTVFVDVKDVNGNAVAGTAPYDGKRSYNLDCTINKLIKTK